MPDPAADCCMDNHGMVCSSHAYAASYLLVAMPVASERCCLPSKLQLGFSRLWCFWQPEAAARGARKDQMPP